MGLRVRLNGRLVVRTRPGFQLAQAACAEGVATAEADRAYVGGVELVGADGAVQEVCPVRCLHDDCDREAAEEVEIEGHRPHKWEVFTRVEATVVFCLM